jgi:hypothetical protein
MTRRRPAPNPPAGPGEKGPDGEAPEKKYSLIVPEAIDQRLQQIMRQRRIKLSALLREIISDNVERYVDEAHGRGECDELGFSLADPGELTIHLNKQLRQLVTEAARDLNLRADAIVQLLLGRHLPALVEEGRRVRAKMQTVLGGVPPIPEGDARKEDEDNDAGRGARPKK